MKKIGTLHRNTRFHFIGATYILLAHVPARPEPYFILENVRTGLVFESRVSPDLEVQVVE